MPTDKQNGHEYLDETIKQAVKDVIEAGKNLETLKWLRKNVLPLLPAGTILKPTSYAPNWVTVEIPKVDGRQWAGPQGTAGLVYQVRKALGVSKFTRETSGTVFGETETQNFSTRFTSYTTIDGRSLYVVVDIPGDKPNNCEIVWEETVDTAPRIMRRAKSVCRS